MLFGGSIKDEQDLPDKLPNRAKSKDFRKISVGVKH
jgi:hypothetical protein